MSYLHRCLSATAGVCSVSLLIGCSNVTAITGAAAPITPPTIPTAPPPTPMAKAKFVYTGNQGASLSGYTVDPSSGALTPLTGFPMAFGTNPEIITHDPQNRFLIVTDAATSQLHVLAINNETGALAEVSTPPYATLTNPYAEVIDPTGTHVYVVSLYTGVVGAFNLNSTGVLTEISGSPFPTGVSASGTSLVMNSEGTFLYVQDIANLYVFSVNTGTGALTLRQTLSGPVPGIQQLALDPAEDYLYVVGSNTNSILSYSIDPASGLLKLAKSSPTVEELGALTITLSPSGLFAYTIESNNITFNLVSYSISSGKFTPVGKIYPGVLGAQIAVDPSGSFVYVPQACSYCLGSAYNIISEFSVGSTGALTPLSVPTVVAGVTPWGITVISQ
jgi:6-phosphogluconolactonase